MIRYLITDGTGDIAGIEAGLLAGVDFVQIRERDLGVRDLAGLTRTMLRLPNPHGARILVNDRADVALACGAHGVHLRDGSVSPAVFAGLGLIVSVACHSVAVVAQITGADYILLSPVFAPLSKESDRPPLGLDALRAASLLTATPILALGGITATNASECMAAGAAGIAGIDYFRVRSALK